ncbi:kinase-like protein [Phanerochaete sordida]|uniref:Kinase-like protein n=1 Tax=Phanerochaete sordida TaxID=48140 RepID=A0A9P3LLU4_9APHY|nr:kinase-like protein [Phanerochaete sordida]
MHRLDRYKEVLAVDRLRQISSPFAEYALPVRNISLIQGKYDNDGDHAYFTTDLYGGSVESLRHLPPAKPSLAKDDDPRRLPKKLAKRILLHVLRGIAHTHRCFVVHGDIRPSNVLFSVPKGFTTRNITDWITADPPRFNPPEQSDYCTVQSSVSQPLPLPASLDEVMDRTFVLADYGGALTLTKDPSESRSSCSFYYQAPEVILGAYCDEKMDIWSFGCMAYELLTGEPLFWPDERAASAGVQVQKGIMLHQMMCFAAETFSREQLAASEHARTWFDDDGRFQMYRHILTPQPLSFICVFMDRAPLESLDDIMPTAYFLEQCFRLDPERRPTSGKPGLDYNYL